MRPGVKKLPNKSTSAWFAFIASGVKRGSMLRKSVLSSLVFSHRVDPSFRFCIFVRYGAPEPFGRDST